MEKRSIKKNSYTTEGRAEIAMPPLDETPPIANIDVFGETRSQQPSAVIPDTSNAFGNIPDQVPDEVIQEMTESEPEQELEEEVTEEIEEVVAPAKKTQADNFRDIRKAKEKAEYERDLLLQALAERNREPVHKRQEVVSEVEDSDFDLSLDDEALMEGKHGKKMYQAMKKMRDEMRSYRAQSTQISLETQIRSNFPDFEKVVSEENVAILNEMEPEIAQSLSETKNMYAKAASAYKIIKKLGIYKNDEVSMAKKQIVAKNAAKPKPLASVSPQQGDSPLSKANAFANGMTKELQEQLRREMMEARKRN